MAHKARHAGWQAGGSIGLDADAFAREIESIELPPTVAEYADRYDRVVGERRRFCWKRVHALFDEFTLSTVPSDQFETARELKLLLSVFVTTLDDLAEGDDGTETFRVARTIPDRDGAFGDDGEADVNWETVAFLEDLWNEIETRVDEAPRADEFRGPFEFDVRQTIASMEYSMLLNDDPSMANRAEVERFDAYNMTIFPFGCVDVMHSPSFDRREFGTLRSLLCELQQLTRIGNWLATWERELHEGDPSSGIAVCAIERGVVAPAEFGATDESTAAALADRIRAHGIEREFVREWELRHRSLRKRTDELRSVDGAAIVDAVESVTNQQLAASEGQ